MSTQVEALLAAHGGLASMRRTGTRLVGRCPAHGGDNDRAFVVDLVGDRWYCFTRCGGGGPVALARALGLPVPRGVIATPICPPPFVPFTRTLNLDPYAVWLRIKGIMPTTAARYEAGVWRGGGMLAHCAAVRLRGLDGAPLGYAGRRLDPVAAERRGKWTFPRALPKAEVLYGWHLADRRDHVVVTECPWGVMRLAQIGVPAVALLGTRPSPAQLSALRTVPRVTLMFDGDTAGRLGASQAAAAIGSRARVVDLSDGHDPDDLTDEELRERASFLS